MTKTKKILIPASFLIMAACLYLAILLGVPQEIKFRLLTKPQLEKFNYCSQSSDCEIINFSCGCDQVAVNKINLSQSQKLINEIGCSAICDHFFTKYYTICENNKCIIKSEQAL